MNLPSVERVQNALRNRGLQAEVLELSSSTRIAKDAANSLGWAVAQIAKSLVFVSSENRHVLVIASGAPCVDEDKLISLFGHPLRRATGDQVRELSGFTIGGVAPLGTSMTLYERTLTKICSFTMSSGLSPGLVTLSFD